MTIRSDLLSDRDKTGLASAALRWTAAAMLVTAAHGAAVWTVFYWRSAEAMPNEPPPAVMIDLAPVAVAPDVPDQEVAPGPQMTEAAAEPQPEHIEKPIEKPEPQPEPAPVLEKVPELPKNDNADAVLTPPPAVPQVQEKPPEKRVVEQRKPINQKRLRAPRTSAPAASHSKHAEVAAAPALGFASAPSASPSSWKAELMARLNRYKRYPDTAGTGTVMIAFSINRSGSVIASRLVRSSGDRTLDQEAIELPRRASPLPPPPANLGGGGTISLSVPIHFSR
jgi:protein TonB